MKNFIFIIICLVSFVISGQTTNYEITFQYDDESNQTERKMLNNGKPEPSVLSGIEEDEIIATNELEQIRVFPNPTKNIVYCEVPMDIQIINIELYDLSGILLMNQNISNSNKIEVDLTNFSSGTYILILITNNGNSISRKIIKI